MGRILKYLLYLLVLAALGLAGYAAFFELPAPEQEITVPLPPPVTE
jgi:hypothetical protein